MSNELERAVDTAQTMVENNITIEDAMEDVESDVSKATKDLRRLRVLGVFLWSLAILVVVARLIYG